VLKYTVSLALVLAIIWLLFSGMWYHPIIVPLGIASVTLTVWLTWRLAVLDREGHPAHLLVRSLRYWPWLLLQILQANLHVARRILSPKLAISPRIVRLKTSQHTDLGRTILANSITLTPGTVSIHVRKNEIWFYALDAESAEGTLSGEMDRRSRTFEGESS
jgi:multicomponent Na+:H+ antiporter subunit E